MGLRQQLLPAPAKAAPARYNADTLRDLEGRITRLVCKLSDESARRNPDHTVLGDILDDIDMLVADYRREQARRPR